MAHPLNPGCWELQSRRSEKHKWEIHSRDNDKDFMDLRFKWWSENHVEPGGSCRLFRLDDAVIESIFTAPGETKLETNEQSNT